MSMHDPFFGVYFAQFDERQSKFFYGFKVSHSEQAFFQGLDKPFSTSITFWYAHKGR